MQRKERKKKNFIKVKQLDTSLSIAIFRLSSTIKFSQPRYMNITLRYSYVIIMQLLCIVTSALHNCKCRGMYHFGRAFIKVILDGKMERIFADVPFIYCLAVSLYRVRKLLFRFRRRSGYFCPLCKTGPPHGSFDISRLPVKRV